MTVADEKAMEYLSWRETPPEQIAFSSVAAGIFVGGENGIALLPGALLEQALNRSELHVLLDRIDIPPRLVTEQPALSLHVPSDSPVGAAVDEEDRLVVFATEKAEVITRISPATQSDSIVEAWVAPSGNYIAYLEETDRYDQALLVYQWHIYGVSSKTARTIEGTGPTVRPPEYIGWLSPDELLLLDSNGMVLTISAGSARPVRTTETTPEQGLEAVVHGGASGSYLVSFAGEKGGVFVGDPEKPFPPRVRKLSPAGVRPLDWTANGTRVVMREPAMAGKTAFTLFDFATQRSNKFLLLDEAEADTAIVITVARRDALATLSANNELTIHLIDRDGNSN